MGAAVSHRLRRGLDHLFGRGEIGLANAHVDDVVSGLFTQGGLFGKLHDVERRDVVDTLCQFQRGGEVGRTVHVGGRMQRVEGCSGENWREFVGAHGG